MPIAAEVSRRINGRDRLAVVAQAKIVRVDRKDSPKDGDRAAGKRVAVNPTLCKLRSDFQAWASLAEAVGPAEADKADRAKVRVGVVELVGMLAAEAGRVGNLDKVCRVVVARFDARRARSGRTGALL